MKEEEVGWGERSEKEEWLVELVGDQNPGSEAPSKGKRGRSKGDVKGRAMEKSRYFGVFENEEVRRDDPIEYFLPTGVGSTFWVPEGVMAMEVSQNEEISGGGKDGRRKGH